MFLLDEMQAIDIKRREGNSTAMADGELESAGSLLDLTSQTMGGVEI